MSKLKSELLDDLGTLALFASVFGTVATVLLVLAQVYGFGWQVAQ